YNLFMNKNSLENLEIKLINARVENEKAFEKFEKLYKDNYKDFLEGFFKTDILGVKKLISTIFQLESLNGKNNSDAFRISIEKGLTILPLNTEKKEKVKNKILKLENKRSNILDIFIKNSDIKKDKDFPIIESLLERKILDNSDFILLSSEFNKKGSIKLSIDLLDKNKKDLIKKYLYLAHPNKKEENIKSFKVEYNSEIKKIEKKYPQNIIDGVVKYVGRNFFKMKPYKKNIESRKLRLKRTFKIALLKLLRIKYSGFNIEELINKINSMQDFESMFRLIMKLIDIIPENSELLEKFIIAEDIDEIEENISEAEKNKEKILSGENSTIKICELLDASEKKLDKKLLDKILDDDISIVGNKIITRKKEKINRTGDGNNVGNLLDGGNIKIINAGILEQNNILDDDNNTEEDEEELEELTIQDLEIIYNEIKLDFSILDKEKLKYLISDDYENLEITIDKIIKVQIKLEKIEKLIK
ncbi:MAG: hypothetical protein Q9M94_00765, partial [Candidatus Gracilibacteria bacterium]|nr:hypothetical protein [Candidatus Gracilibacteria bacterium]